MRYPIDTTPQMVYTTTCHATKRAQVYHKARLSVKRAPSSAKATEGKNKERSLLRQGYGGQARRKVKTMMSKHENAKRRLRIAEKRYAEAVYDFYRTAANPEPSVSLGKYDFFGIGVICHAMASREL